MRVAVEEAKYGMSIVSRRSVLSYIHKFCSTFTLLRHLHRQTITWSYSKRHQTISMLVGLT